MVCSGGVRRRISLRIKRAGKRNNPTVQRYCLPTCLAEKRFDIGNTVTAFVAGDFIILTVEGHMCWNVDYDKPVWLEMFK